MAQHSAQYYSPAELGVFIMGGVRSYFGLMAE